MVLSKFLFTLGLKTLLILATLLAIAYSSVYIELVYTPLVLAVLVVFQVVDLWTFVKRTNDDLARFLLAIQTRDFTARYSHSELDPAEKRLHQAFHLILDRIQQAELERQGQYLYLKSIVEHIPAGVIALNEREEIDLINPEAQALLDLPEVTKWQRLRNPGTRALEDLLQMYHGESRLMEVSRYGAKKYLSVSLYVFKLHGSFIRLYTLKDIAGEIDQKELEAWIKLTRVLTHEIMNSVTPLLSLTETMISVLSSEDGKAKKLRDLSDETMEDLMESLLTIRQRSSGLLQFVEDYKKFTRVPEPKPELLNLAELLSSLLHLTAPEFRKRHIKFEFHQPESAVEVMADRKLLEQVLINLFANSMQAMETRENAILEVTISSAENRAEIRVKDNGVGIAADKLEQIFIPFFSTKREGSGIGLSLSRQILHKHKGTITVASEEGLFTEMIIRLPLQSSAGLAVAKS